MSFLLGGDRHRRAIPELNKAQWGQSIAVDDPAPWMNGALNEVNRLSTLERGWDGFVLPPIRARWPKRSPTPAAPRLRGVAGSIVSLSLSTQAGAALTVRSSTT